MKTTLTLKKIDGLTVPYQNGIPLPSFDPQDRLHLSLSGEWIKKRFQADHDLTMADRGPAWLEKIQAEAACLMDDRFHLKEGETKHLPFPENKMLGEEAPRSAETYEDGVWYSRTFFLPGDWAGKAVTLKCLGLNYVGDFWLNGRWVGVHEGGFTPFAFDVTPFVKPGSDNVITIRVDNPPWGSRRDIIPAQKGTDFFNYTGLIQDLYLEGAPLVMIARADIVPTNPPGNVKVTVVVENRGEEPANVTVRGAVFAADPEQEAYWTSPLAGRIKGGHVPFAGHAEGHVQIPGRDAGVIAFEWKMDNPALWSIGQPNLYIAEFALTDPSRGAASGVIDRFATQFGIRTAAVSGTQILLNGEPVFLAGIARHEEWPDTGRTATWDKIRDDLLQIRDMNANLVRTGHYPNHVYTYLLLDRLGLAAMSEIPLWQLEEVHFEIQNKRRLADQMWREMVFSQYNRPSVLLWSTQNESSAPELRKAYNERLVRDLRENYNDGRLITQSAAADRPGFSDPSMEPLDVAGWTMYFGVFHGGTPYEGTRSFLEQAHRAWPNKPILNTEFGHWTGQWDEEADKQLHIYKETLKALTEKAAVLPQGSMPANGYVAGINFWIMYNWYVNHNEWIDTFGLFHMDRKTGKPLARLLQDDYRRLTGGILPAKPTRQASSPS